MGMLGAVAAWAILEPVFDDYLYIQGKIISVDDSSGNARARAGDSDLPERSVGTVVVNGETILLLPQTKEIRADKSVSLLDGKTLKAGDETGFYVEYFESAGERFSTAAFAVRSPPPQSPGVAKRTLHQLEARKSAAGLLLFPLVSWRGLDYSSARRTVLYAACRAGPYCAASWGCSWAWWGDSFQA